MDKPIDSKEDRHSDNPRVTQKNRLPVDRGWAWVILAASWVNQFIMNGLYRTFGILFPEIQRKFGASSSTTSLIPTFYMIGYSFTTVLVQTVGLRYLSTRQAVMAGSLGLSISYVISAFCPVVELLLLFQGFTTGIASGMMFAPTNSLVGEYFDRKRGFALCVTMAGGSMGMFVFSFLLRNWLDNYGFTGTLMFSAAVAIHGMVSGALQRPTSFYNSNTSIHVDTFQIDSNETQEYTGALNGEALIANRDEKAMSSLLTNQKSHSKRMTYLLNSQGSLVIKLSAAINNGEYWRNCSTEFTSSVLQINTKHNQENGVDSEANKQPISQRFKLVLRSLFTANVIKRPVFLICLPVSCILSVGTCLPLIFLPPHAKDIGLSDKQASLLVTIMSIAEILSIPLWGYFADKKFLDSRKLVALSCTIMGIMLYFISFFTTATSLEFLSLVYGCIGRVYVSMYTLILVDILGVESFKSALGIQIFCQMGSTAVFSYILGAMRDAYGSYVPCFQLLASLLIVGAIGMMSLRFFESRDKETTARQRRTKEIKV